MNKKVTFSTLERSGVIKRADARKAELKDLHEEPGFNLRDYAAPDFMEGIRALADYIAEGGIYPALEVRLRPEGGLFLVDGHRRTMALNLLVSEGRLPPTPDGKHWVSIVPFEGNDADRLARILTSNDNRKLSAEERARGFAKFRAMGFTNAQIATSLKCSVSHVVDLLTYAGANTDVQTMVKEGEVSASVAIATVKKHGEKAGEVLKAAKGDAPKVKAAALKPKRLPEALVDRLIESLAKIEEAARQVMAGEMAASSIQIERMAAQEILKEIEAWREV